MIAASVVEIVVVNFQCSTTPWRAFGSVVGVMDVVTMVMTNYKFHSNIAIGQIASVSRRVIFDIIIFDKEEIRAAPGCRLAPSSVAK
jgi:hypothetical protein